MLLTALADAPHLRTSEALHSLRNESRHSGTEEVPGMLLVLGGAH
jgi:hypothetical protein